MFTYKLAQSDEDFDRIMVLIQNSYANSYPGFDYKGLIKEPYFKDVTVESIMLFYEQKLVGTISILQNRIGGILPSEYLLGYGCPIELRKNTVEIGRLAKAIDLALDYSVESKIFPVLLWLGACQLIERKEEYFICSIQNSLFRQFTRLRFQPTIIDEGIQTRNVHNGKGDYLKEDTKFIYANSKTCYDALSKMDLSGYTQQENTQNTEIIQTV